MAESAANKKEPAQLLDDAAQRAKVKWDDSAMRTSYANVCNVQGNREEVALLFGTNQTGITERTEFSIRLSDRIILSPYAAKRLAGLLNKVVVEYESRFGKLESS